MDSPPLSKLLSNAQFADESFGDMSLPSADSPAPMRTGTGFGSLLNRPAPTRNIEETPRVQRTLVAVPSSRDALSSSSTATVTGREKPRNSIFGITPSHTLKSSTSSSFGSRREPQTEALAEEEHEEEEALEEQDGEGEGEGDRTITIDQEQEEETAVGRAAREERLKDSLYELRGINDTFEMFLGALESARGHNEVCHASSIDLDCTDVPAPSSQGQRNFNITRSIYGTTRSNGAYAQTTL